MGTLIPVLPRLKTGASHVNPPSHPGWDFRELGELNTIANALDVSIPAGMSGLVVDAIPDMWARILLFAFALNEPGHPLHDTYLGAFRGFLSLLCFRGRKNFDIQVSEIELNGRARSTFRAAAQKLRPKDLRMHNDTLWDRVYALKISDQIVGITSPLTLVCPAEGLHLTRLADARWCFDGFRFRDPVASLDEHAREDCAAWIQNLLNLLSTEPSEKISKMGGYYGLLLKLLDSFKEDLVRNDQASSAVAPNLIQDAFSLPYGIYQHLRHTLESKPFRADNSWVRLRNLQLQRGGSQRTLLIVDKDLDKQWGEKASGIMVAEGVSLADVQVMALGSDRTRLGRIKLEGNVEWRDPHQFFSDRLVFIRDAANAFPGAWAVHGQTNIANRHKGSPILPLKKELLDYLTPEYIRSHAYFRETTNGVDFGIRLPLEGNRGIDVWQSYQMSPSGGKRGDPLRLIEYQEHGVPVLEIWPDFASPRWHNYFVFWDSRGGDVFYARPSRAKPEQSFRESRSSGELEREVTQLSGAPDFIECTVQQKQADGSLIHVEAGILIPHLKPLGEEPAEEFQVGVDFGTTNTNVYLRKGDGSPYPLELRTVTHQVTAPLQSDREEALYRSFLPPAARKDEKDYYEQSPFLSFFSTRSQAPQGELHPIKHGHVLFYHVFYNHPTIGTNRVSTNLKWKEGHKPKLECYIRQIALHASVEAFRQGAQRIQWHYSLPTAFPLHKVDDFRRIWAGIVRWVHDGLGLDCGDALRQTESVAAARYFASLDHSGRAFPGVGAGFIDIGGGTSDISIWQDNRLLSQCSIRLSGDQMILNPLFRLREQILPLIPHDIVPVERCRDLMAAGEPEVFYAKADALLRGHGKGLLDWLVRAPGDNHLKRLVDYIGLGLSGLFFYTGLMFRHLEASGQYEMRAIADRTILPSIHVGGNGSKLLHWVAKGLYDKDAPITQIFRAMLLEAAGWNGKTGELRIQMSPFPKAEAACGLVTDYPLDESARFDEGVFRSVVSGEKFTIDALPYEATALLERDLLKQSPKVRELNELIRFAGVYNNFAVRHGWDMRQIQLDRMLPRVVPALDEWIRRQSRAEVNDVELEPLFVVGLKEFLSVFLESEA